jgi:hypothetical protein
MAATKPLDISLAQRREPQEPLLTHDRLGRRIKGPCLVWTGVLPKDGYPRITHRRSFGMAPQLVHRVAYAIGTGVSLDRIKEVPPLDHLCRRPACSAVAHLEPTTRPENLRRGNPNQNERKDRCDAGHLFSDENTYVRPSGNRQCRECKRVADREWYRRRNRPDLIGKPPTRENGRPRTSNNDPKPRRDWQDGT